MLPFSVDYFYGKIKVRIVHYHHGLNQYLIKDLSNNKEWYCDEKDLKKA